jgi:hypothetical protein
MTAAAALKAARAAGIELGVEGNDLVLEAAAPPPAAVLDLLARHKTGLLALLRPGGDGWSAEDWNFFFDECAGLAERNGGLSRVQAEARAVACCLGEWLSRNPVRSPAGSCLHCGGSNRGPDPLLPYGTETTGHAWLHSRCWTAWRADRKAEAVAALSSMGIRSMKVVQ